MRTLSTSPAAVYARERRMADRVRFHLSQGRDAGDIAIREGIPVSVAQKFIEASSCIPASILQNESAPRKRGRA